MRVVGMSVSSVHEKREKDIMKYTNILIIFFAISSLVHAEERTIPLEEIVVTPSRTIVDRTISEQLLTASEIDEIPLIDNDILRAVQTFPGVAGNDFTARFNVRGGEKDETLILLDGMELYAPYHLQDFGGAMSIIDLLAVSNAQLIPGGFPAEYGDKMSAVLDIKSVKPKEELQVNGGIDLLNTHLMMSQKPFFLSVRRGYIDLLMGMIETEEDFAPKYSDIFAKFSHDFSPKSRVTGSLLYADDTNAIDEEGIENDVESEYDNSIGWAKWHYSVSDNLSSELYLFAGQADQQRKEGDDGKDNRDISYWGTKTTATANLGTHKLKAGIKYRKMRGEYHYKENVTEKSELPIAVDTKLSGYDLKGFVSDEWKIVSFLAANFGTRLSYQSENEEFYTAPRVSLAVMPFDGLTLRGAWGVYHQAVTEINLPVEDGVSEIKEPEKAVHYLAGAQYENPVLNLNIKLDAYYKDMDNLVGQIKDYGKKTQILTPVDSAYSKGIELSIEQSFDELFYSLGYTYSVAKENSEKDEFYRDFDQRHTVGLSLGYSFSENTFAYASWRFHTGNPYTKRWYEDGKFEYGHRNGERLPPYHSLDLRVSKRFDWKKGRFKVYLQVLNLYNRQNVHEYSYALQGKKTKEGKADYERQEEHFLPIMPTLGLNVEF